MLKESLLENKSIRLNQTAADWKSAIKIGTDLLEASGAIEPRYYDNIVSKIEEMGPYIILAPGVAMPHARPEEGVLKTAFALTTLKEPIYFEGDDQPIRVLITLAGSDSDVHIAGIMEITQVLDDDESESGVNVEPLLACQTEADVLAVIDAALA